MCNINCVFDYYFLRRCLCRAPQISNFWGSISISCPLRRQLTRFSIGAILILLGFSCVVVLTLIFCLSAVFLSSLSLYVCMFAIIICLAPPTLPPLLPLTLGRMESWDSTAPPITFSEKVCQPAGTTKSLSKKDH